MLCAIFAVKKTTEVRWFILVLLSLILWCGGSVLMRLQVNPGIDFWFMVSIVALFSAPLLLYFFVCSFAGVGFRGLHFFWTVGTIVMLALTAEGLFLKPPVTSVFPGGGTVFLYDMTLWIGIPFLFLTGIIVSTAFIFKKMIDERGMHAPGVQILLLGCLIVAVANIIQIFPGNVFPWDTLSGIVLAVLMLVALHQKRMVHLTLIVSRSMLLFGFVGICFFTSFFLVKPTLHAISNIFPLSESGANAMVIVLFTALFLAIYAGLHKLIDLIFTKEERQEKRIAKFSNLVSRSLNTEEILTELMDVIREGISVRRVYICLPETEGYRLRYCSAPVDFIVANLRFDEPAVLHLYDGHECFVVDDFRGTEMYKAMRVSNKTIFGEYEVGCVTALRDGDNIKGLVLLSSKKTETLFTAQELDFLSTVMSIASIAVKNANLYEQVFREARIDSLTGVYNYKYFIEKISQAYVEAKGKPLSLVYLDIDDFKLYNQLYGMEEGDFTLKKVADLMVEAVGNGGTVFRHSGKMFAVLLPECGEEQAYAFAKEMQRLVGAINSIPERRMLKTITLSGGISSSPRTAGSAKELMENTGLAIFNAKTAGKGKINVFRGKATAPPKIAEKVMEIIERPEIIGGSSYNMYSCTIKALTAAIDAKDHYTFNHSQNVAWYSSLLATAIGLNDDQVRLIYEAALLHDIGKISIPEAILSKSGSLTWDEFTTIRGHVNSSIDMIRHLPSMDYVIPAAVGHHERWDGKGYPLGIAGEDIPIAARCLAIADAFDAMTADRPYRQRMSLEYAIEQLEDNAGTQFDPRLAHMFVQLLRSGEVIVESSYESKCISI